MQHKAMHANKGGVTMFWFWLSAGIVIGSNVAYHFCQKTIPAVANPMLSLVVTFATAGVTSFLVGTALWGPRGFLQRFGTLNWASVVLGLTIVGVDVGYLLLYRSGWAISLGSVFCNSMVALMLMPVGVLLFKERLTLAN
jgi:hypothetical protein